MEQVRWGIIGCGDVVLHKSGPALARSRGSVVLSAMRRDETAAREYALTQGIPKWSNDAASILSDSEIDIVYVATPPSTHAEYVVAAAEAGKHVLVEKPMAMSAREGEAMCAACEQTGVELFVAYYRRFQPHVVEMRRLIGAGDLGEIVQAHIDIAQPMPEPSPDFWRLDPEISGGGLFIDIGAHRIDALVSVLGRIKDVCGFAAPLEGTPGVERALALALTFETGAQCTINGDFHSGRNADHFEIHGTKGRITADPLDGHLFSMTIGGRADLATYTPFPAPHYGLIRHIEAVLMGNEKNASSGRDAVQTERVLDVVREQVR